MKRNIQRIYRQYGIKYFAAPVVVILVLAALFDQHLGGYLEKLEEAADLGIRLENNRNILDLNGKIQRSHDELEAGFLALQSKAFVDAEVTQSVNRMQEQLRQLLQSLYFDNIEFTEFSDTPKGAATLISMNVRFNGVPQQLPRLETALAQSPQRLSMSSLEIKVIDDPQRGTQQLAIVTRLSGLHMKPIPELPAATASSGKKKA